MLLCFLTHKTMVHLSEVSLGADSEMEIYVHKVSWEYLGSKPVRGVKETAVGRRRNRSTKQLQQRPQLALKTALEVGWP